MDTTDDPLATIRANDPRDPGFDREASFFGILYDEGRLDWDAYWQLERAIFRMAQGERDHEVSATLFSVAMEIAVLFRAHCDPRDVFVIEGISPEELFGLDERLRHVCHCYFEAKAPGFEGFMLQNPLLE